MIHDGCVGCIYEEEPEDSKKCKGCRCTFLSKYSPKGKEHVGCEGCDYEHTNRKHKECKKCMHSAVDKYIPKKK